MAEEFGQDKSEAPTQRRREEARQQGQVALSLELSGGALLLAGVLALWLGGSTLANGLLAATRWTLLHSHHDELGSEEAGHLLASVLGQGADLGGVFLAIVFSAGLAIGVIQVGFFIAPELAGFKWERISITQGLGRLFSLAAVVRGLVTAIKVCLICLLALWVVNGRTPQIVSLCEGSLAGAVEQSWDIIMRLAVAVAAAFVVVGVADYVFQRWRHERSLMMTKQELKDDVKREEGDPHIRARIRKMQREMSRKRMLEDVPRATVVITNPTHLAIALRYERGTMAAPRVIAKGAGFVARRIADLARRHAVPVVERKPVAQALYKGVQIGQEIPTALFYAVAEVLAYVHRLRGTV